MECVRLFLFQGRYKRAPCKNGNHPDKLRRTKHPLNPFYISCFLHCFHFLTFPLSSSFSEVSQSPSPLCHLHSSLHHPLPPLFSLPLCLERKRWPLNVSAGVWGSGEQPSHCMTPPWTPDGLMNKGKPPPPFMPDPW